MEVASSTLTASHTESAPHSRPTWNHWMEKTKQAQEAKKPLPVSTKGPLEGANEEEVVQGNGHCRD